MTGRDAAEEDEEAQGDGRVPVLPVGGTVTARDGRVLYKKTEPPTRYTQATLIKRLEGLGIGRPSTYPAILKNVQVRGYVEDEGKYLRPTGVGEAVVDGLVGKFGFVEYAFTRDLERDLDRIAEGAAEYLPVVRAADERLREEIAKAGGLGLRSSEIRPGSGSVAPPSGGSSQGRSRTNSGGASSSASRSAAKRSAPASQGGSRWELQPGGFLASRLRARPDFLPEDPGAPAPVPERTDTSPAKRVRGSVPKKRASSGAARAKAGASPTAAARAKAAKPALAEARSATKQDGAPVPCPVCKEGIVRLAHEDAKAWGCSRWPETKCPLTIWRVIAGRAIKDAEMRALCRAGETKLLKGFNSKAGTSFEAALKLSAEGKVELVFQKG